MLYLTFAVFEVDGGNIDQYIERRRWRKIMSYLTVPVCLRTVFASMLQFSAQLFAETWGALDVPSKMEILTYTMVART